MTHQARDIAQLHSSYLKSSSVYQSNFFKAKLIYIIMELIKFLPSSTHWTQRNLKEVEERKKTKTDTRIYGLGLLGVFLVYLWTGNLIPHLPSSTHCSAVAMLPALRAFSVNTF